MSAAVKIGRALLMGAAMLSTGASSALAGPGMFPFWHLLRTCSHAAPATQCAVQYASGDNNTAHTSQTMDSVVGHQTALTVQLGNGNKAYTTQIGTDEKSLTIQNGNNNYASTYQNGSDLHAKTVQNGDGHWSMISQVGDGGNAQVTINSY